MIGTSLTSEKQEQHQSIKNPFHNFNWHDSMRESLCRLHVRLRTLVVGIGDALHTVLVHKEIVYLCHIALCFGCKDTKIF